MGSVVGECVFRSIDYAHKNKMIGKKTKFDAIDGIHEASLLSKDIVRIGFNDVKNFIKYNDSFVTNTGSPHYIKIVNTW